jgi:hypothetical protein
MDRFNPIRETDYLLDDRFTSVADKISHFVYFTEFLNYFYFSVSMKYDASCSKMMLRSASSSIDSKDSFHG